MDNNLNNSYIYTVSRDRRRAESQEKPRKAKKGKNRPKTWQMQPRYAQE